MNDIEDVKVKQTLLELVFQFLLLNTSSTTPNFVMALLTFLKQSIMSYLCHDSQKREETSGSEFNGCTLRPGYKQELSTDIDTDLERKDGHQQISLFVKRARLLLLQVVDLEMRLNAMSPLFRAMLMQQAQTCGPDDDSVYDADVEADDPLKDHHDVHIENENLRHDNLQRKEEKESQSKGGLQYTLVQLLEASPDTLLLSCLKQNRIAHAHEVMSFFSSSSFSASSTISIMATISTKIRSELQLYELHSVDHVLQQHEVQSMFDILFILLICASEFVCVSVCLCTLMQFKLLNCEHMFSA